MAVNALNMVNAYPELTSGLFTRSSVGFSTVIDYVLDTTETTRRIGKPRIYEEGDIFSGSNILNSIF